MARRLGLKTAVVEGSFAGLDSPMPEGNRNRPTWIRYSGVGFEFVGAVVCFTLVGIWIDGNWDTRPWGLLICVALGLTGATYNLIRTTMKAFGSDASKDHEPPRDNNGEPPEQN